MSFCTTFLPRALKSFGIPIGIEIGIPIEMALYKYPGYETGQGWTMKPGNLEGGFWGDNKPIFGAKPSIFPYIYPRIPPQDSKVSLSTPGLFHTLDICELPDIRSIGSTSFLWILLLADQDYQLSVLLDSTNQVNLANMIWVCFRNKSCYDFVYVSGMIFLCLNY